jgi:hypothetical protein
MSDELIAGVTEPERQNVAPTQTRMLESANGCSPTSRHAVARKARTADFVFKTFRQLPVELHGPAFVQTGPFGFAML